MANIKLSEDKVNIIKEIAKSFGNRAGEVINVLHPTEEAEFGDCKNIEDRRPKVGLH